MDGGFQSRFRSAVDLVAAFAIIVTAGVVLWGRFSRSEPPPPPVSTTQPTTQPPTRPEPVPTETISLEGAFLRGSAAAPVAILEYADLECPACARFANETLGELITKYVDTGRVRFGFRHFPLPNHRFARDAAIGAQCAGEQGKFWEAYETLYRERPKLNEDALRSMTTVLGLDGRRWSQCVEREAGPIVDRSLEEARKLGLSGTPTFLIGTVGVNGQLRSIARLNGAQPMAAFEVAIKQAEKSAVIAK